MLDVRFPREERLKSRTSIGLLFSRSSRSTGDSGLRLIWTASPEPLDRGVQVLVAAPKKHFKRAVVRNRIKRLLREAYRKQKHVVYTSLKERNQQYALHFIFTGKQLPNYPYVFGKMNDLILRFCHETSHAAKAGNTTETK